MDAGDGLCDEDIVSIVVKEGPESVREIIEWGARFDKNKKENMIWGREGGHSENRILHYKDLTGWEIQRTLVEKADEYPNIEVLEHYFAVDLITQHHLGYTVTRLMPNIECYGAYALNKQSNEIETLLAKVTVLAAGGAGQVYRNTTNPVIASGDGIAMAYRAKGPSRTWSLSNSIQLLCLTRRVKIRSFWSPKRSVDLEEYSSGKTVRPLCSTMIQENP